jgi:hypothetical protein
MNILVNIIGAAQAVIASIYQYAYTNENNIVYTDENNQPYTL